MRQKSVYETWVYSHPAINALKSQMQFTRMREQKEGVVNLREYGKHRTDICTFFFNPSVTGVHPTKSICYGPGYIPAAWNNLLKRAGSRHTNAQMVFSVYVKWMAEQNGDQIAILNQNLDFNAHRCPIRNWPE